MYQKISSYIEGLRNGSDELNFICLDNQKFQSKMDELAGYFEELRDEILLVREKGYENTDIIEKSEIFFRLCDEAVGLSEEYSQRKATALDYLEKVVIVDILGLILLIGAELIKGKKVAPLVRFLVVPASAAVYEQALKEGIIDTFMESGAIVMNPNCSVCWGSCQGVIGENEVLISTGTRNFKGRAGHPSSKVYLGSAATVTASAIKGEIALASDL